MKRVCCALVLLAIGGNAPALEPSPVLVTVLGNIGSKNQADGSAGLLVQGIGAWANHSVNKQSARKVQSFMRLLATPDFPAWSQEAFRCFASTQPCSARPAFADAIQFADAVRAGASQEGYVIELLPELVAEQLVVRGTAYRVRMPEDGSPIPIKVDRAYHALYTTRAPASLTATRQKAKLATLEAYWSEGDPRRLVTATNRALTEINRLFAILIAQEGGGPGEVSMNLNEFPDKKRLVCKGEIFCRMMYLWKDNGDSFVVVANGNFAGWYDAEAAAFEVNLPAMVQFGPRGTQLPEMP